jgi:dTMP kinase
MNRIQGKFIVFDGGEGCGKSTQAQLLKQVFETSGARVLLVRDPGSTTIGELIRAILLNPENDQMSMRCEMLLYMAARAQMMKETILPALDSGAVVISDRFVSSTLSYQLGGDGLTKNEIEETAEMAIKGRWPDLTIILDMPPERSIARVKRAKDRIELRPPAYHEQVRKNYLTQATEMPDRYRVIAADRTLEEVHADVLAAVRAALCGTLPGLAAEAASPVNFRSKSS